MKPVLWFQCVSCGKNVAEPMILNGLRLCESCSEELAATKKAPLQGLRQPSLNPIRGRRGE